MGKAAEGYQGRTRRVGPRRHLAQPLSAKRHFGQPYTGTSERAPSFFFPEAAGAAAAGAAGTAASATAGTSAELVLPCDRESAGGCQKRGDAGTRSFIPDSFFKGGFVTRLEA